MKSWVWPSVALLLGGVHGVAGCGGSDEEPAGPGASGAGGASAGAAGVGAGSGGASGSAGVGGSGGAKGGSGGAGGGGAAGSAGTGPAGSGGGGASGSGGGGSAGKAGSGGSSGTGGGAAGTGGGAAGTGGGGAPGGPGALFVVPSVPVFGNGCSVDGLVSPTSGACYSDAFDHPFPSDLRTAGGKPDFTGWPNPNSVALLTQLGTLANSVLDGFSPQAAGYLRFTESLDPATLPADPGEGVKPTASVQLIDTDDASPDKGKRHLISLYFRDKEGVYWAPSTLSFQATFGYPLRPRTRYAVVVTTDAKTTTGKTLTRPPHLDAVLGLGPDAGGTAKLRAAWAPAIAAVEAAGVAKAKIAHLSVFTTSGPTEQLFAVRDHARANYPAPKTRDADWKVKEKTATYEVYEGNYGPSPNYQQGKIPFANAGDGGDFVFTNGAPVVQGDFDLRFALVIPNQVACPMPAAGYPIVLYAHGTGGNYRSFLSSSDGTAATLAAQCLASMGIDQIFHGTRPGANSGTPVELLFYNVLNATAGRTNGQQAAIDEVQRARLFTESGSVVPAAVSNTGSEIKFDSKNVMFFGHSQGGLNGPLYLAADDAARGGVLSGSGSVISIAILEKTKPPPTIASIIKGVLGLKPPQDEELNLFHPAISLVQNIVDVVDPIHYVGRIATQPRTGFPPKSIYQTEGVNADFTGDSYAPPHGIEAQAVATGLPLMNPVIHPVPEMAFGPFTPVTIPMTGLSGNLAGGKATGVLAQWKASLASDGHFVVFDIPAAKKQAAGFCKGLSGDPKGFLPPP